MSKQQKILGRTSGSLNAPIAAFTMAIVLGSYCISSIRSARREAANLSTSPSAAGTAAAADGHPHSSRSNRKSESWVQQALEESRELERRKGG